MALLLAGVAVLVALIITPGLLLYFDVTPKAGVLLAGVAIGLPLVTYGKPGAPALPRLVRWFALLLGIQGVALLAATAWSPHWQLSIIGTNWRRFGLIAQLAVLAFAFLVTIVLAGRRNRVRLLLRSITLSGIVVSAYGTAQYFGWDPWLPASAYVIGEGEWAIVRPPSTLGYASYAATLYLFGLFTGIGLARTDPAGAWRGLGMLAAALGSAAVALSGTRAAIVGLAVGAAFLIAIMRPRITRAHVAIAGLAITAMASFYISPAGQKLRSRTRWYIEDPRGGARLLLWRDSLRMAAARPLVGWGPETFTTEFPRIESKELARAYPDFHYESPHNILIDSFVSAGIVGLAGMIAVLGIGFYAAFIAGKESSVEGAVLAGALAASLVAQQFTVFIIPTALYFYMTIAILVALAVRHPIEIRRSFGRSVAFISGASVLVFYVIALTGADRLLAQANNALGLGDLGGAMEFYRRSRGWQPPGSTSDLWYSRSLARFAQRSDSVIPRLQALEEGYAAAVNASRSAEVRHNAFYNLATYCALREDFAGVEASLRQAIQWAPNWFKPHWTLAQALQLAGRLGDAETEATIAADLNGGKNAEVRQTLVRIQSRRSGVTGTGR